MPFGEKDKETGFARVGWKVTIPWIVPPEETKSLLFGG
jgi:hypothetical protein